MKNLLKIFVGIAAVTAFASCNQKVDYQTDSFVCFETTAYSINEDAGTVEIPVFAYAKSSDHAFPREGANTSLTFEVIENTAKNGVNFSVEPANGVIDFSNSTKASIKLNITNLAGEFTSDLDFTIVITSANNDFSIGGLNTLNVTIKDLDHPLAELFGTYVATNIPDAFGAVNNIQVTVGPIEGTTTSLAIHNVSPTAAANTGAHYVVGDVNEEKTEVTVKDWQLIGEYSPGVGVYFVSLDASLSETESTVFTYDPAAGTLTTPLSYGAYVDGLGWFDAFIGPMVFTKQ